MNTSEPAQNASWAQTSWMNSRLSGDSRERPMALTTSPAVTTATTPDTSA